MDVVKEGKTIPAKVVYIRNKNKKNEYLCLISTEASLSEEEIIRIYGKRRDIEVFFKVCKSYLNLSKECRSISYDAMTAHTAIVLTRYMMLSVENRESNDTRSMGELFLYFSDEMSDITWIQAFQMLLQMFRTLLADQVVKKTGKTETYNTEELEELNQYLDKMYAETEDTVFLAVKINFLPGLRVGELVALKWEDCKDLSHLHVVREEVRNQETNQYEAVEHTKAREIYLYEEWGTHYRKADSLCVGKICRKAGGTHKEYP